LKKILIISNEGKSITSGISKLQEQYINVLQKYHDIYLMYNVSKGLPYKEIKHNIEYKNKTDFLVKLIKLIYKNNFKFILISNLIFYPFLFINIFIKKKNILFDSLL